LRRISRLYLARRNSENGISLGLRQGSLCAFSDFELNADLAVTRTSGATVDRAIMTIKTPRDRHERFLQAGFFPGEMPSCFYSTQLAKYREDLLQVFLALPLTETTYLITIGLNQVKLALISRDTNVKIVDSLI
jgi:hypothetical protein